MRVKKIYRVPSIEEFKIGFLFDYKWGGDWYRYKVTGVGLKGISALFINEEGLMKMNYLPFTNILFKISCGEVRILEIDNLGDQFKVHPFNCMIIDAFYKHPDNKIGVNAFYQKYEEEIRAKYQEKKSRNNS